MLGMIAIDRKRGIKAIKEVVGKAHKIFLDKRVLIMFPEGTRVNVLEKRKYNPGISALHKSYPDIPILPLALNSGKYWPKNGAMKCEGTIKLKFLPVINSGIEKEDFLECLQNEIDTNSNDLSR